MVCKVNGWVEIGLREFYINKEAKIKDFEYLCLLLIKYVNFCYLNIIQWGQMVINHHISNVMVPIGLRAAFHGLIGLESSFEAFPENHGLLSSMSPVRNPQCPPSTPLLDPPSWHTSNWDISTKLSGYLPYGKKVIQEIRNDPVIHVSNQEASMSSK